MGTRGFFSLGKRARSHTTHIGGKQTKTSAQVRCHVCNRSWQFSSIRFSGCSPLLTTDSLSRFWFRNRCLIYSNFITCHFSSLREGEKPLHSPASLGDNSPRRPSGLCKAKGDGSAPHLQHHCPVTHKGSSILYKTLNPHTEDLYITNPRLLQVLQSCNSHRQNNIRMVSHVDRFSAPQVQTKCPGALWKSLSLPCPGSSENKGQSCVYYPIAPLGHFFTALSCFQLV